MKIVDLWISLASIKFSLLFPLVGFRSQVNMDVSNVARAEKSRRKCIHGEGRVDGNLVCCGTCDWNQDTLWRENQGRAAGSLNRRSSATSKCVWNCVWELSQLRSGRYRTVMGKALLVAVPGDEGDMTVWNIGIWPQTDSRGSHGVVGVNLDCSLWKLTSSCCRGNWRPAACFRTKRDLRYGFEVAVAGRKRCTVGSALTRTVWRRRRHRRVFPCCTAWFLAHLTPCRFHPQDDSWLLRRASSLRIRVLLHLSKTRNWSESVLFDLRALFCTSRGK